MSRIKATELEVNDCLISSPLGTDLKITDLVGNDLVTISDAGAVTVHGSLSVDEGTGPKNAVVAPASSTDGAVATFDGGTGKLLKNSTKLTDALVTGPASVTANAVALFDSTSGKVIKAGPQITASATDTTAGSVLKVGDFGIGVPIHTTNLNTLTGTGLFSCGDVPGTPGPAFLGWWVHQIDVGPGWWKNQTAWEQHNPTKQYVRSSSDGTVWSAWSQAVFADSPVFTGTPTVPTAAPGTSNTQAASTEFVTTAGNLKANLASPAFTGAPTAPTAPVGNNTPQLANTAFVKAAIAAAVDFTIVYPNGGTALAPAKLAASTRYVETNPFPGYHLITQLELLVDGVWMAIAQSASNTNYYGGFSGDYNGSLVVVTAAIAYSTTNLGMSLNVAGSGVAWTAANITGSRVKVWKVKGATA